MRKSNLLYLGAVVLLIFGLWGILALGERLQAPFDLSGSWALREPAEPDDQIPAHVVKFDQSGRFVTMRVDQREAQPMRWISERVDPGGQTVVELKGSQGAVTIKCLPPTTMKEPSNYNCQFRFSGKIQGLWFGARQSADD